MAVVIEDDAGGLSDGVSTRDVTVNPSGSNRYILVGVSMNNNDFQTYSSVVFDPGGGDELSLSYITGTEAIVEDDGYTRFYGAVAPATGSHTVRVTISAATQSDEALGLHAWALSGVDQSSPTSSPQNDSQTSVTSISVTITTAADDLCFAICHGEGSDPAPALQSPGVSDLAVTGTSDGIGAGHEDGTTSVTMDFNLSFASADKSVVSGINIQAATGAVERSPPQTDLTLDMKTPTVNVPSQTIQGDWRWRSDGAIGEP